MMTAGSREDGLYLVKKAIEKARILDLRYMGTDGKPIQSDTAASLADVKRTKDIIRLFKEQNAGLDAVITRDPTRFDLPDIANEKLKNTHMNHMHFQKNYPRTAPKRLGRQ